MICLFTQIAIGLVFIWWAVSASWSMYVFLFQPPAETSNGRFIQTLGRWNVIGATITVAAIVGYFVVRKLLG
jgi:hypothetical protein